MSVSHRTYEPTRRPSDDSTPVLLTIPDLGLELVDVALSGEDRLGQAPRTELTFVAPAFDPESAMGVRARLVVGGARGRTIGGVIAEVEVAEHEDGRTLVRAVLAPRASLLARGRASRTFERLSTPDIVEAVVASSGFDLRVERRLAEAYPARPLTVQHRESDLDFVTRLLERDGIALLVDDDGERCTLVLADRNEAYARWGDLATAGGLIARATLAPRSLELVSFDPMHPDVPLRAAAPVSASGAGVLEVEDLPFSTPEQGARLAAIEAERWRARSTKVEGVVDTLVPAGTVARVAGRELLLTEVTHERSSTGRWTSRFTAIAADRRFRPERRTPTPKVDGLMSGRIAPRHPDGEPSTDAALYRVLEPSSGGDRPMPLVGGLGIERTLAEGTHVVWGCVDGDPERPLITSALQLGPAPREHGRAILRGPGGSAIELGGHATPGLDELEGLLLVGPSGAAFPTPLHHGDPGATGATGATGAAGATGATGATGAVGGQFAQEDTITTDGNGQFLRFAVPGQTYLRLGDPAPATLFTEPTDRDAKGFKLITDNMETAGSYAYTDLNRTEYVGQKLEQVVRGEGRIAIHAGSGEPKYELWVRPDKGTTTQKIDASLASWTTGTTVNGIAGLKFESVMGSKFDGAVGGILGLNLGIKAEANVGYQFNYTHADSYEYRKGEMLSDVSTQDMRAREKIQFSIYKHGGGGVPKEFGVAIGAAVVATLTTTLVAGLQDDETASDAVGGALAGVLALTIAVLRATSKERDLVDGDPILSLDEDASGKRAALRADDWLLMLTPSWATLGKNRSYAAERTVTSLQKANAGTSIILEENEKITIQAGETNLATLELNKKTLKIVAETITIEGIAGANTALTLKGDVKIDGKLTAQTLEVTGETTLTGASKIGGQTIAVNP
jgi:hypothetical protein